MKESDQDRVEEALRVLRAVEPDVEFSLERDETIRAGIEERAALVRRRIWRRRMQVAAAAAVLLLSFAGLWGLRERGGATVARDLNGDGAVDVIDVLVLARAVESNTAQMRWDWNEDGRVDAGDVDALAADVVRLVTEVRS